MCNTSDKTKINIAFADDDIFMRMSIKKQLKQLKNIESRYIIDVLYEGIDGSEVIQYMNESNNMKKESYSPQTAINVIILDFIMEIMDGVTTARLIRENIDK